MELDVQLTKDNQLVVYHDSELTRLFANDTKLKNSMYATDFNKPLEKVKLHFNVEKFVDTTSTVEEIGEGKPVVPLFSEVLAAFPNNYFNVDCKTHSLEAVNKTIQVIKEAKAEWRVCVGSNKTKLMRHMRKSLKGCAFWCCQEEVKRLIIALFLGFLPYIDLHFDAFLMPFVDPVFGEWEAKDPYIKNSKFKVFLFYLSTFLAPVLYPHLTKRGIVCAPWVVNTKAAMLELVKMGATGVVSDDPKLMTEVVKEMGVELDRSSWMD